MAIDTNTDFEVRSENAMCVNQSELDKPLISNIKYLFAGLIFGIFAYRKCFDYNPFTCMV